MEMFGLIMLFIIGGVLVLSGLGYFLQGVAEEDDGRSFARVLTAAVLLVVGGLILWTSGDWAIDNYDIVRVR